MILVNYQKNRLRRSYKLVLAFLKEDLRLKTWTDASMGFVSLSRKLCLWQEKYYCVVSLELQS